MPLRSTLARCFLAEHSPSELVGSQHGWNAPLPLEDQIRVGWACVGSKPALWYGPSVPFKPCFKAAVCKRVFQPTPTPSIIPHLLRAGGEPGQAWEVHSHACSHRRVLALVTEMGSAPINPICFACHCQVWVLNPLVPQADHPHKGFLPGGGPSIAWHEHQGMSVCKTGNFHVLLLNRCLHRAREGGIIKPCHV